MGHDRLSIASLRLSAVRLWKCSGTPVNANVNVDRSAAYLDVVGLAGRGDRREQPLVAYGRSEKQGRSGLAVVESLLNRLRVVGHSQRLANHRLLDDGLTVAANPSDH